MFGSLLNALKGLQGEGPGGGGGLGEGLLKGLGDFTEGFSQSGGSGNPWGDAIGQIGAGIQTGLAAREKEKGMPPRVKDNSDVPLALPMGSVATRGSGVMGGAPPGVADRMTGEPGYETVPGAPSAGPAPHPDTIGMPKGEPLPPGNSWEEMTPPPIPRFKDQYANRPLMF